jgi:RNA polymerase primary sigma factor
VRNETIGPSDEDRDVSQSISAALAERVRPGEPEVDARGLSPERELALVVATDAGDRTACQQLVRSFLPAIAALARRHAQSGITRDELVQDGVVGLLQAVRRFDPRVGAPFWGYASWWVRKAMQEHVAEVARPVALSDHTVRALSRLRQCRSALAAANGHEPTSAQLSAATGFPRAQLDSLLALERPPLPLEEPLTAHDEARFGDDLADPAAEAAYEEILNRAEMIDIRGLVDALDQRQRMVLADHYGLGGPARTFREIGVGLGVTAERVRQIEADALAQLRAAAAAAPTTAQMT